MLRVLVVEDEEMIRKGIVLTVDWAALDCVVVGEAANGEEALDAVEKYSPSLIITDLKMPIMDGIEMLTRLRERGCDAYVIILTAYDSFTYAQSALRLGAVDFLLKPFRDGELEQAIMTLQKRLEKKSNQEELLPTAQAKKGSKSRYVVAAIDFIAENYNDPDLSVSQIAENLGVSEGHLSHIFKRETDYTILNHITRYRINRAMKLLKENGVKVYEVAEMVGYRDITHFSATFKKLVGISPSEYQDKDDVRGVLL